VIGGTDVIEGMTEEKEDGGGRGGRPICFLTPCAGPRVYIEVLHQQAENLHEPVEMPFILGIPGAFITTDELYKLVASRVVQNYSPKTAIKGRFETMEGQEGQGRDKGGTRERQGRDKD
jgi:hypothetical protein